MREVNVTSTTQVQQMVDAAVEKYGRVDILMNNAGINRLQPVWEMSDETWDLVIGVNLTGTFYCTRAAIRHMLRQRWGRVISIASVVGMRGNIGQANYAASKAGIIGFTKSVAREVANRNITVNAIAPGYIETATTAVLTNEQKDRFMAFIPQERFGQVDDIAHLAAYLAGDKANYITGQVIAVDGGMSI